MTRPRDAQKAKVLAAIAAVPFEPLTWSDVVEVAEHFLQSTWWQMHSAVRPSGVFLVNIGGCKARYITLGSVAVEIPYVEETTTLDVVHRLIHLADPPLDQQEPLHGPTFCRRLLSACVSFIGLDTHQELKEAFETWNVRTTHPSTAERAAADAAKEAKAIRGSADLEHRLRKLLNHLETT